MSIVQMLDFREAFSTFPLPESLELRRCRSMGRIWLRHAHPGCVKYNISVTTKPNTRRQYTRPSRALLEHVVRIFEHLFDRASGLIQRIGWPIAFDQLRPAHSCRRAYRGAEKEKAPQVRKLVGLCHRFWRRRRDSNPRSRFWPRCSLSRGVPSTSRPRLPNFRSHQGGSATRTR